MMIEWHQHHPDNVAFRQAGNAISGNGDVRLRPSLVGPTPRGSRMVAEQLRRAVEASPRVELPKVSALLWKAYAAGQVSEAEASDLSNLIEARRALPKPTRRRSGSRPRSGASLERRRRWSASGLLPPNLACKFTLGEVAALAVIAAEHV